MWSKCPICNGTGKIEEPVINDCPTCKRQRIISELNGLPPNNQDAVKQYSTNPYLRIDGTIPQRISPKDMLP